MNTILLYDIHSFGAWVIVVESATTNTFVLNVKPAQSSLATLESFLKSIQFISVLEDSYCMLVYRFQRSSYYRAYVNFFSLRIARLKVPLCWFLLSFYLFWKSPWLRSDLRTNSLQITTESFTHNNHHTHECWLKQPLPLTCKGFDVYNRDIF